MDPNLIGIAAGFLTTVAFIPQILKVHKNRSARDISWRWIIGFLCGIVLWIAYGIIYSSLPIMLANLATFILVAILAIFKMRYGKVQSRHRKRTVDYPVRNPQHYATKETYDPAPGYVAC